MARPMASGPSAASGWGISNFDDGNAKEDKVKKETERFQKFVQDHARKLEGITDQLEQALVTDTDSHLSPIQIDLVPFESLTILDLVQTKSKLFNKVLMALSALSLEIDTLKHEAHTIFFPPLVTYGETLKDTPMPEGESQERMGRMMSFFQDACGFVNRIYAVVLNLMQQLGTLYAPGKSAWADFNMAGVHQQQLFEKLADALGILLTMDTIIKTNDQLQDDWTRYKQMLSICRGAPTRVGSTMTQFMILEKMLQRIAGTLLEGHIFNNCLNQRFDYDIVNVTKNSALGQEMDYNVRSYFGYLAARIGEHNETDQRERLVGFCGLYLMFTRFYMPNVDKKFFKDFWNVAKKVPVIHLYGNVSFSFQEFIASRMSSAASQVGLKHVEFDQALRAQLKKSDETITATFEYLYNQVCCWMVRMQSELAPDARIGEVLNTRLSLLLQGMMLAANVSHTVKLSLSVHLATGSPIVKSVARALARLIELLKAIEDVYVRQNSAIARAMPALQQFILLTLYRIVTPIRDRVSTGKRMSDSTIDTLASLELLIAMLDGPPTRDRLVTADLALSQAQQQRVFQPDELEEIRSALRKLDALTSLQQRVGEFCRTEFIFWNRSLLPTYFASLYEAPHDASCLQYFMTAIEDARPLLRRSASDPKELLEGYEREITDLLFAHVIRKLADDIEKDLIWCSHPVELRQEDRNPFKTERKNLTPFLRLPPVRFFDKAIDIKTHVTHHLDRTLYNLTTVRTSSWTAFAEMRNLALDKYGIAMTEVHLPVHTVEQGADVLEIMRNIHSFVARFNYNMNSQLFVEKASNSKHLDTINIRHVANSIRTHGTGMMNTTINVTYQFLRKKFATFSEFLHDDHIKSRLIKEARFFRDNKAALNQRFPFDRAEKFTRTIRDLGQTDGLTYLDQFRILITSIGNALGYVRMMRSGGLHHSSTAINFVPDVAAILEFEDLVREESLSQEDAGACQLLDKAVDNLAKNFGQATDYFQLLVNVFTKEVRDPKNVHLRNFYIIIPALTINFVEYMLFSKERIDKKRNDGATFTDDGFAMGVAYVLKLLGQNAEFDALHWFASANEHYVKEIEKLASEKRTKGEAAQSLLVTKSKLQLYQREYDLVYVTLTGARIFFREEGENFASATVEKKGTDNAESSADAGTVATVQADPNAAAGASASTDAAN